MIRSPFGAKKETVRLRLGCAMISVDTLSSSSCSFVSFVDRFFHWLRLGCARNSVDISLEAVWKLAVYCGGARIA
ncbi:MAG: hypothetical protein BECKG1743F_GA0114225_103531, partial [Candidatus Kentron sp. G]